MNISVLLLALVAFLALPTAPALAQSTSPGTSGVPTSQQGNLSSGTVAVLRTAISANLFEIESSRLALGKTQSTAIKEFANRMVGDHTRAAKRARRVLRDMGATPPLAMLEPAH
jgi:putative membrane protein